MSIRHILVHEMNKRMISDAELAQLSSVSKSCIQKIRNGKTNNPTRRIRRRLADALSIPYETLLDSTQV